MWGLTTVVAAFAVPLAIVAIAVAALMDFNRRRKTAQSIHGHRAESEPETEFTERDRQTLVSE